MIEQKDLTIQKLLVRIYELEALLEQYKAALAEVYSDDVDSWGVGDIH